LACASACPAHEGITLFYRAAKSIKLLLLTLGLAMLASCSSSSGAASGFASFFLPKGNRLDWNRFTLMAAEGANLNTPLAVDLVLVQDDAVLGSLLAMPASKWFGVRADMVKTFPEQLRYLPVEMVPGQIIALPREKIGFERVVGALVFADYQTPGEHRLRVDALHGDILIQLDARAFAAASPQAH
jgi:type VI secretion system protein